jgi:hypothetical protein
MLHKGAAHIPDASQTPLGHGDAVAGGGEIAVQFLTTSDEFARLAPEWNRLHGTAAAASVFNSWLFQYQWWQVYGAGQPLRILVALERGEAVGILALYIQKLTLLGVPVRLLRFAGTGADTHPDDVGPVLAPGKEHAVALKLARAALRLSRADVIVLSDIDPQSAFAGALERAAAEARRASLSEISERIAYVELPRSWPQFLQSLASDRRTRIKSARRKAAAAHRLRFFVWDDLAGLDCTAAAGATLAAAIRSPPRSTSNSTAASSSRPSRAAGCASTASSSTARSRPSPTATASATACI